MIAFKPILDAEYWNAAGERDAEAIPMLQAGHAEVGGQTAAYRAHHSWTRRTLGRSLAVRLLEAIYDVFVALLGYLLMLAVMTMNLGYFLSVLAGVFLGNLGLGGIARHTTFDHC
ncbi:hypothetical protein Cob_v012507 [Colletotrichum orbiculare MAFF 240422]|uniref:Copper transport protein n=1 Tax=Colletotrichum orbiculare (strain 104-T / ATCC 96160 / CBS 514.97 / LARS 414 / MAFF 240422) TaxID=1213857 RepID=A0A484F8W3_COLOR|nr:hypothetical protein Cob_v012507 [Colletotrichum orbiculare MAFF 240422]